ncbi:hypothetical protein Vretimale_14058 [Volvox reticuliferus]|nr:hypothetical protein Vretimale_14058 [Volvox reticuliferus]
MTCAVVDHLALVLPRLPQLRGVRLRALHGRMKQAARERELEAFRQLPAGALLCTDLAARGLDIPDVHWIVQLDPPQDPAAFVHRVGRTARMGRQGNAVVYLQPHEEAYVEFLTLRKIPITEGPQLPPTDIPIKGDAPPEKNDKILHKSKKNKNPQHENPSVAKQGSTVTAGTHEPDVPSSSGGGGLVSSSLPEVLSALRRASERDREVMERATKAFVTYVRGYKEHHCKFIFRLQDLNVGRLATGLGLLRLPKMPDLKKPLGLEHFTPSPVDPATVPYKDKIREKQRLKALQQRQEAAVAKDGVAGQGGAGAPAKRKLPAGDAAFESRLPAAKRRQLQQIDEVANLNAEYSLLKKVKKGKITEHQYDIATGLSSESDADEDRGEGGGMTATVSRATTSQRGETRAGREGGPAGGGHINDDAEDSDDDADEDGEDAVEPAGLYRQGGAKPGVAFEGGELRGLHGGVRGRGQQLIGVRQSHSALQSYIDKKAKKIKKKKKKNHQQQAGVRL